MGLTIWDTLLLISERLESFTAQHTRDIKMKCEANNSSISPLLQQHQCHCKARWSKTYLCVCDDVLTFQWHAVLPVGLD